MKNLKRRFDKKMYHLIFLSDTNPVKIFVAIASIFYGLIAFDFTPGDPNGIPHFIGHDTFAVMMLIYAFGLIWRVFDNVHRTVSSLILTVFGMILWTSTTWQEVYEFLYINNHVHDDDISTIATVALASCWLLVRCGSGEVETNCNT